MSEFPSEASIGNDGVSLNAYGQKHTLNPAQSMQSTEHGFLDKGESQRNEQALEGPFKDPLKVFRAIKFMMDYLSEVWERSDNQEQLQYWLAQLHNESLYELADRVLQVDHFVPSEPVFRRHDKVAYVNASFDSFQRSVANAERSVKESHLPGEKSL